MEPVCRPASARGLSGGESPRRISTSSGSAAELGLHVVVEATTGQERESAVHCPYCRHNDSRVLDSRVSDDGTVVRRRRQCTACERRFSTQEQMQLMVVKKSGAAEPFSSFSSAACASSGAEPCRVSFGEVFNSSTLR